jgi:hypothetical protein
MLITAPNPHEMVYEMAVSLSPMEIHAMGYRFVPGHRFSRAKLKLRCDVVATELTPGIVRSEITDIGCSAAVKAKKA